MGFLYMAGASSNHILSATLTGSSEDANFPWSELNKSNQFEIGRMNAAGADDTLTADLGTSKAATFCSVHFHNLDSGITSFVLEKDDNSGFSSPDTVATITIRDQSFFATFASASDRYWRLKANGTNGSAIYYGGWALGVHASLTRLQLNDWQLRYSMEQSRASQAAVNRSLWPRRGVGLSFQHYTEAQKDEVLMMLKDSKWGQEPIVIVPDSDDPTTVLWARAPGAWSVSRSKPLGQDALGLWGHDLVIEEEPFPVVVT